MNMATIATQKITEMIEQETGIACLTVAGNYDIDKKPAWLNIINCRGKEAWSEAVIPAETVQSVLKTTSQKIFDVWLAKCMLGSAMSGSMGFNCHFANVVAALFLATGQDAAHVVEGSAGITTTKVLDNGDLYISVFLPAVMVGTIGGGNKLKTQTAARSIMNITSAIQLAEVTAGTVLAGELSLLASLSAQSLATSHQKLGR
jgi:hydroxymethylglutaryl-CoA reductase (NADPH)